MFISAPSPREQQEERARLRLSWKICHSNRAGGGVTRPRADSAESLQTWQETKPSLFYRGACHTGNTKWPRAASLYPSGVTALGEDSTALGLAAGHRIVSNICMVWNNKTSLCERERTNWFSGLEISEMQWSAAWRFSLSCVKLMVGLVDSYEDLGDS